VAAGSMREVAGSYRAPCTLLGVKSLLPDSPFRLFDSLVLAVAFGGPEGRPVCQQDGVPSIPRRRVSGISTTLPGAPSGPRRLEQPVADMRPGRVIALHVQWGVAPRAPVQGRRSIAIGRVARRCVVVE